ncbi:anthrone oxygenase family protein [Mesorhizobium sp. BAC0120]|uniref:anthrone oxygenase family protein n=1 Tax=Mesorhizobium sp. BAC0120 TaxID=3090670 RepID=UPI00298D570E|nr:anthrone oxygenase family protein [Mesorhizobium sp. BAC0120]MDW6025381.1 anthrone oxygenase family protein [Mesorhizobium sp. BAC0120]
MTERIALISTFLAALGAGMMGGLFFIFSNTVMAAFGKLPAVDGIAAMNSINLTILNGTFLGVFMGTALISAVLLVSWFLGWMPSGGTLVLAGSLVYLVGILGVTMVFNVPMNDALAAVQPDSAAAASLWQDYLSRWTMWNHVRTIAGIGASTLFILALAAG